MESKRAASIWQRVICGLFCIAGVIAVPFNFIHRGNFSWHEIVWAFSGVYGSYLFGHIAWRGRLPGKVPGTAYVRFRRARVRRRT